MGAARRHRVKRGRTEEMEAAVLDGLVGQVDFLSYIYTFFSK